MDYTRMISLLNIDYNSLQLKEIGVWPLLLRLVVVALSGLVVMIMLYCFWLAAKIDLLNRQKVSIADKKEEISIQKNNLLDFYANKKRIAQLQLVYETYLNNMQIENMSILLDKLTKLAVLNELKVLSIKIDDPVSPVNIYRIFYINLSVATDYHKFAMFMSNIAMQFPILSVDRVTMSSAKVDIKLVAYFEIIPEEKTTSDVTQRGRISPVVYHGQNLRSPFTANLGALVAPESGVRVGSLETPQQRYVLIKDQYGTVHMVIDDAN